MLFQWDDEKEKKNINKHGIDFSTAALVFGDDKRLEIYDEAGSREEERFESFPHDAQRKKKGRDTMLVEKTIDVKQTPTKEQVEMLKNAEERPVTFDKDAPRLSEEQLLQFKKVSEQRREERRKQTVTLRLSPQALAKARSLGKGYTSVLSRMLEEDLNDNERIRACL